MPVSILIVVDLPAPFGPMKPSSSPGFHLEGETAYRFDRAVLRLEEGAHRAAHPGGFALGLEGLAEVGYFDCRH